MIRPLSLIASFVVLLVLAAPAWADGMPVVPAAQTRCGSGPFAGPYIGAAAGFVSHQDEATAVFPVGGSPNDRDYSFTFGGYAGYNWQCDHFLIGAETDINWADTSASAVDGTSTVTGSLEWYGTVRARLGYVIHDHLLVYGTGGFAYANVDHRLDDTFLAFSQSNGDLLTGWTLGGGIEGLHDSRWLLRAEAFYVDLGDQSRTYTATGGGCPVLVCTLGLRWEDEFWVGRLGLTYKFGHREEVVPLK